MGTDRLLCTFLTLTLTHLSHVIITSFSYTCGLYQVVFLDIFSRGVALTSWVASLNFGLLCLAGMSIRPFVVDAPRMRSEAVTHACAETLHESMCGPDQGRIQGLVDGCAPGSAPGR